MPIEGPLPISVSNSHESLSALGPKLRLKLADLAGKFDIEWSALREFGIMAKVGV
jgi:hypothetical protein